MGPADLRVQAIDAANIGKPFALAHPLGLKALGPGHTAVERSQHKGHARCPDLGRKGRGSSGRQGRDAMDHIEAARADIIAKPLPDQPFEIGVAQRGDCRDRGPAAPLAHAQRLGHAVHGGGDSLAVDGGEVLPFDQTGAQKGIPVADLRHDMDIGVVAQGRGQ